MQSQNQKLQFNINSLKNGMHDTLRHDALLTEKLVGRRKRPKGSENTENIKVSVLTVSA